MRKKHSWKLLVAVFSTGLFVFIHFLWSSYTDSVLAMTANSVATEAVAIEAEAPPSSENPYAAYTYYQIGYSQRYSDYQLKMPELDIETVLWHVNAGLDQTPYSQITEMEGKNPLLVNKRHKLPDHYEPAELVTIHGNVLATPGTAEAFQRMRAAAMRDGVFIEAAAGYRSLEAQKELFETEVFYRGDEAAEETIARPGFGEHSTGRALHIVDRSYTFDGFEAMPEYFWLVENCADYGFILRYGRDVSDITGFAHEPYHFTFVGRDIALAMEELHIGTLEEYAARGLTASDSVPIDDRVTVVLAIGYSSTADHPHKDDIVQHVQERLEKENVRVVVTQDHHDDAQEPKTAALIGIEITDSASGIVAWFESGRSESLHFAETICSRFSWAGLEAESRGMYEDHQIALARLTGAPAVLIELSDAPAVLTQSESIAKSISDAIIAQLGIRKMYLTFDDGPSPKNTPKVLEILKEKNVKATFFVVGEMAEAHPDMLRQIVAEGHAIGIHSYSHDYQELYASVESFLDDFFRAQETIQEITGIQPVVYRFPGGSINHYNKEVYEAIVDKMNALGYVYFDWNLSSEDASRGVKPGDLLSNIKAHPRYRHAVLLMHDAYPNIAEELCEIIDSFSDYQMDVIDENTKPVQF